VADLNVVPNFIQGLAMGKAIGVGLRSVDQWWDVTSVALDDTSEVSVREVACMHVSTHFDAHRKVSLYDYITQ
jgi:hypothetical protein